MTQTTSRSNTGSTSLNPALARMLDDGRFDWDNPRHREAFLRAWMNGAFPLPGKEEEADERGAVAAGHNPVQG